MLQLASPPYSLVSLSNNEMPAGRGCRRKVFTYDRSLQGPTVRRNTEARLGSPLGPVGARQRGRGAAPARRRSGGGPSSGRHMEAVHSQALQIRELRQIPGYRSVEIVAIELAAASKHHTRPQTSTVLQPSQGKEIQPECAAPFTGKMAALATRRQTPWLRLGRCGGSTDSDVSLVMLKMPSGILPLRIWLDRSLQGGAWRPHKARLRVAPPGRHTPRRPRESVETKRDLHSRACLSALCSGAFSGTQRFLGPWDSRHPHCRPRVPGPTMHEPPCCPRSKWPPSGACGRQVGSIRAAQQHGAPAARDGAQGHGWHAQD